MTDRAIVKRSSLKGLAEGWDGECYAYIKPATVQDKQEFRRAIKAVKSDDDNLEDEWQLNFVSAHWVGGKVKVLNEAGDGFELTDMTKEDLNIAEVSDKLIIDIMGMNLDPKALSAAAAQSEPQPKEEASTETPSSETTGPESPKK